MNFFREWESYELEKKWLVRSYSLREHIFFLYVRVLPNKGSVLTAGRKPLLSWNKIKELYLVWSDARRVVLPQKLIIDRSNFFAYSGIYSWRLIVNTPCLLYAVRLRGDCLFPVDFFIVIETLRLCDSGSPSRLSLIYRYTRIVNGPNG